MTAQQLKNSILQMAVQGKLVPQDPNDEPASVLLERIRTEKEQLIKEGKIKKEKNPSYIFRGDDNLPYEKVGKEVRCIADEVPFEIPDSWEWVRLKDIAIINGGYAFKSTDFTSDGVRVVRISDFNENGFSNQKLVRHKYNNDLKPFLLEKKNIILCMTGGTVGKSLFITQLDEPMMTNQRVATIKIFSVFEEYINIVILSPITQNIIHDRKNSTNDNISMHTINNFFVPLPPLEEQHLIVKKYKKILFLINEYKNKEVNINKLVINFPDAFKKSILQQAVMGKLVPQDSNDEPASVLLEHTRAEKSRLIKEGKIKKDKHESVIYKRDNSHYEKVDGIERCIDDEIPFEIPDSWEWVRLKDIVYFIGGYAYKSNEFIEKSNYQLLRLGNIKNDKIDLSVNPVFISYKQAISTHNFKCIKHDILITMTGTRLKRDYFYSVLVTSSESNLYINQRVGCLRSYISDISYILIKFLKSECILSQVFKHETGTANQGNLGAVNILHTLIPIPPLTEQQRIVNKINDLLPQIEKLQ